jgi:N-glycosidase YbiA
MKYQLPESEMRSYTANESCLFKKNIDEFGGLSNMSTIFPLRVNQYHVRTSEALYQACRFPFFPELQKRILEEPSPMKVKMISNANKKSTRDDWENVKVLIMRWCLQVKLAQHFIVFGELICSTGTKCIVENSSSDNFWGAVPNIDKSIYKGKNALGRLIMELRQKLHTREWINCFYVVPVPIPNFLILDKPIQVIDERIAFIQSILKQWKKSPNDFLITSETESAINLLLRIPVQRDFFESDQQLPLFDR